jgi:preprotein translocase subunit SecA
MQLQINVEAPPTLEEPSLQQLQALHVDPYTGENEFENADYGAAISRTNTPFVHRNENVQVDPNNPQTWGKVQRNAPCPCGSGRKFKHCHGALV